MEADRLFQLAAEGGITDWESSGFEKGTEGSEAVRISKEFRKKIENMINDGDCEGAKRQSALGHVYLHGYAGEQDDAKAAHWLRCALATFVLCHVMSLVSTPALTAL